MRPNLQRQFISLTEIRMCVFLKPENEKEIVMYILNTGCYCSILLILTHLQQTAMMTVTITKIPTNTTATAAADISIINELIGSFEFHPVGLVLGVDDNCCTEVPGVDSCTDVLDKDCSEVLEVDSCTKVLEVDSSTKVLEVDNCTEVLDS